MKRLLILLIALGASAVLVAPTTLSAAKQKSFDESIDVLTIEVPVQVIADGEPVRGLTKDDFEVYDGRKREPISGFEEIDLTDYGDGGQPVSQVPIAGRRHFLILFDMAFSDPANISRARETANDLIRNELNPSDLVAVATYTHQHGPQLVLGFTSDRQQIRLAIQTLGLPQLVQKSADPLSFIISDSADSGLTKSTQDFGTQRGGVNGDALFQEQISQLDIGFKRSERGEAQGRVMAMTTAFEDLAKVLNDVQGRKYVVLLSEGFDSELVTGTDSLERSRELAEASSTGQYWEIDSEERYGSTGAMTAVEQMLEEFRRADATIQAVDIGGLRAGTDAKARSGGQDSLFMLADGTGGEMFRNYNELSGAMGKMLERTSVTYLLAFQAEDVKLDGEYHKLRVKLNGGPRGARLIHRPGFYAPRPFSEMSPMERRLDAADKIISGKDMGILSSSVLAAPFPGKDGKAYVPVLIEIDGQGILAGNQEGIAQLEIYAYAIAEDGTVGGYLTQTMGLDIGKVEPVLRKTGIKFFGDLELAPGDYLLRVLVRDAKTGRSSVRNVPLSVPQLGSGSPSLAMPLFPEEGGKWLMVQEATAGQDRQNQPYPFMLKDQAYMPAAKPVLTQTGSSQFILMAFNLGDGGVPLKTEFKTPDGQVITGPKVSFVQQLSRTSDEAQLMLSLDAAGVPPGEYRLIATLEGADGKDDAETSIPFVVAGG